MASLVKYFTLMKKYPELFQSTGETGEIRIITDRKRIREEQERIRAKLAEHGHPACWIDIGVLSEDQWFYVLRDLVEFPGGVVGGYLRCVTRMSIEGSSSGVVLMCFQKSKVLMIRKFQHENRSWRWEFPRGFGEPGLSAEENARKELEEEIGISDARLTILGDSVEVTAFRVDLPDDAQVTMAHEEGISTYRWITMENLEGLVLKGKLEDWFSLWAYALIKTIRL